MKKIVILFVDAFSYSYINPKDTPFLSKQNVHPLRPDFGFKQLAAAFSGLDSLSTGLFADHYYMVGSSTSHRRPPFSRCLINSFLRVFSRKSLTCSCLLALNRRLFDADKRPFPETSTIISLIQERKLSYRFVFSPEVTSNKAALGLLKTVYESKKAPDILLVHFPELDVVTHREGIKSIRRQELVNEIDSIIEEATDLFGKDSHIITFSDHGMVTVKGYVDIIGKIRRLGLSSSDFVVFLDSLMARFWVLKSSVFKKIKDFLSQESSGTVIINQNKDTVNKFGHIMFVCLPGYIIFPNYYDYAEPPKAMHGYIPTSFDSPLNGIFLTNSSLEKGVKDKLSMTDLMPIFKRFIESH